MANNPPPQMGNSYMVNVASVFMLVSAVFIIGVLLLFLVRVQRGLLGLVLGGLAAALVIYWMREFRQMVKGEVETAQPTKKWTYDVLEGAETVTFVAEIPGPAEEIRVELRSRSLAVFGGQGFKKKVAVPEGLTLTETSYLNGILNVRMSRHRAANEDGANKDQLPSADG
jgi:HSP20 family protein